MLLNVFVCSVAADFDGHTQTQRLALHKDIQLSSPLRIGHGFVRYDPIVIQPPSQKIKQL
jgi:hypothetical protein